MSFTTKQRRSWRQEALEFWDEKCYYCGREANAWDHVIPRTRGGPNTPDNQVPACRSCNSRKSTKSLEEFRAYHGIAQGWVFSDAQIAYLASIGVTLPPTPRYEFWGETGVVR